MRPLLFTFVLLMIAAPVQASGVVIAAVCRQSLSAERVASALQAFPRNGDWAMLQVRIRPDCVVQPIDLLDITRYPQLWNSALNRVWIFWAGEKEYIVVPVPSEFRETQGRQERMLSY